MSKKEAVKKVPKVPKVPKRKRNKDEPPDLITPRMGGGGYVKTYRDISRTLFKDHTLNSLLGWCLSEATISPMHIYKYQIKIEAHQLVTTQREIQRELGIRRVGLNQRIEKLAKFGICTLYWKDLMLIDVSNYYAIGGNGCNHFCNHFLPEVGTAVTTLGKKVGTAVTTFNEKMGTAVTTFLNRWERLLPLCIPEPASINDSRGSKKDLEEKDIDKKEREEKEPGGVSPSEKIGGELSGIKTDPKTPADLSRDWVDFYRDRFPPKKLEPSTCALMIEKMFFETQSYSEIENLFCFVFVSKDKFWVDAFSKPELLFNLWKVREDGKEISTFSEARRKANAGKW